MSTIVPHSIEQILNWLSPGSTAWRKEKALRLIEKRIKYEVDKALDEHINNTGV